MIGLSILQDFQTPIRSNHRKHTGLPGLTANVGFLIFFYDLKKKLDYIARMFSETMIDNENRFLHIVHDILEMVLRPPADQEASDLLVF